MNTFLNILFFMANYWWAFTSLAVISGVLRLIFSVASPQ